MTEIDKLIERINTIVTGKSNSLSVEQEREIIKVLNAFFFSTHKDIGTTIELGQEFDFFSEFHKYWYKHHDEILDLTIDDSTCEKVADSLHDVYLRTKGRAFNEVYDTCGLSTAEVCKIRMLTANQDFNGSRNFKELANIYKEKKSIFNIDNIINEPEDFIKSISVTRLSQTDKRQKYAKNICLFLKNHNAEPIEIIERFDKNVASLREAMIACEGAGYGNKKTDMFLRDMIVLGVWKDVSGFDEIDVASDINTIRIALKTGMLRSAIPLVSSFIDIFSYQYSSVDRMSAKAWRRVWEIWKSKYPEESVESPCLFDYFIYNVIGREFCKSNLCTYKCINGHIITHNSARLKTCPECKKNGDKNIELKLLKRELPCESDEGWKVIRATNFYSAGIASPQLEQCPLKAICDDNGKKELNPPKSISILGQTGWNSAYTDEDSGGGGLMA